MNSEKELIIRLRKERIAQNLTYDDITEKTGLSHSTVYRFFSDDLESLHPRSYTIRVLKSLLLSKCDMNVVDMLQEQLTIKDKQIERLTFVLQYMIAKL